VTVFGDGKRTVGLFMCAGLLAVGPVVADETELPDPLAAGWKGKKVCEKLHDDAEIRVLRCSFPPGVGHERHFHRPNFGYVLAGGSMSISSAEGTRIADLVTGSSYTSAGTPWHEVINVGDSTVVYLVVEPK
jgi:quercetin dioxygenase-like cupin family protein